MTMRTVGDTVRELRRYIDRTGVYHVDGLAVPITCLDVRTDWGQPTWLITPVGGSGSIWVRGRVVWDMADHVPGCENATR